MAAFRKSKTGWMVLASVQLLLLFITASRLSLTRASALYADDCFSCQALTLLQHDAGLWALAWGILLAMTWPSRWLRTLLLLPFMALLTVMVADLVVLDQFSIRLYLGDVFKFGGQPLFIWTYLESALGVARIVPGAVGLLAIAGLLLWSAPRCSGGGCRGVLTGLLAFALALYLLPDRSEHPLPWTYQNVIEANWPSGVDRRFSDEFRAALLTEPPAALEEKSCTAGLANGGDVIIVLLESLSWYHGGLLLENNLQATPRLDALARDNAWWDRFYANGFTTDHGLVALLAGRLPLPAVNRYRSFQVFEGYGDWEGSLPRRLAEDGYFSAFFTAGNLEFMHKRDWLEALRFDLVEGNEHGDYADRDRYEFDSAADEYLYARVLDWLRRERPPGQPLLAVVETVTTHPPFTVPGSGEKSEADAFRYADAALAEFVSGLESGSFFDNGLLIVTSDQRAVTALRPEEKEAFGHGAGARLPLVMKGTRLGPAGRRGFAAQMQDLPFSLDYYLSDRACRFGDQGNWFSGEEPACIFQPEGNRRDLVNAFCGEEQARILLDGDDTRVIEGRLPGEAARLRELNYLRARLGALEADMHLVL